MKQLALIALLFGVGGSGGPEIKDYVEQHCVAVLVEAKDVKVEPPDYGPHTLPYVEPVAGSVIHVAEQTLRLRCN